MISKLLIDNLSIRILLIVDNTFLSITRPSRRNHHRAHKLEAHTERRKFCSLVLSHEMSLHKDEVHTMPEKTKNEKVGIRFDNSQYLWQKVDPDAICAPAALAISWLKRAPGRRGRVPRKWLCLGMTTRNRVGICVIIAGANNNRWIEEAKTPKVHVKICLENTYIGYCTGGVLQRTM